MIKIFAYFHFLSIYSVDIYYFASHIFHIPCQLPQQENSFDCGLFLLHYLELFLEEAPVNFSPFKIIKCSKFVSLLTLSHLQFSIFSSLFP